MGRPQDRARLLALEAAVGERLDDRPAAAARERADEVGDGPAGGHRRASLAMRRDTLARRVSSLSPGILARGPWRTDQVATRWRDELFEPDAALAAQADAAIAALEDAARRRTTASPRGSPRTSPPAAR